MAEEATVTISKDEYDELRNDQRFLDALRACGVDNWIGWDDAREMAFGEDDE